MATQQTHCFGCRQL